MTSRLLDQSQEETALALTGDGGDNAPTVAEIHEGERLRNLLESNRYEKKELADAAGVTKQAVQQWVKLDKFTPRIWQRVRVGLIALRLNPDHVRPAGGATTGPAEDLTRLVENWTRVQLSVLKRILEADDAARRVLLAYINGALRSE